LGFNQNGLLPWNECLVNYPEEAITQPDRQKRLQKAYHTPAGMLRQFTHWFVATYGVRNKADAAAVIAEARPLLQKMTGLLRQECSEDLVEAFESYIYSPLFPQDVEGRLPRVRDLWKKGLRPCTLVVAASGVGSRARKDLGTNKLAYEVDGTPSDM
jgi:hypothetical protein